MIDWILLFSLGFIVAAWNSSIGPTGGALIAGTSLIVPPPGSLLLQGIAALFSNGFRSWRMQRYLRRRVVVPFLFGTALALPLAYFLLLGISSDVLMIVIGAWAVLTGVLSFGNKEWALPLFISGFVSGIASFIAGTGSLVAAPSVRKETKSKQELISNEALITFFQGSVKTVLLLIAFALPQNFLFLLSALLVSVLLGNLLGLKLLEKIPDRVQGKVQMATVAALGAALLLKGAL